MEYISDGQKPFFPSKLKCIDGVTYAVCGFRQIHKRIAVGKWECIADLPLIDETLSMGFRDMDAFSESDMYAVGGRGDVWRFDGQQWKQMGFPTNAQLGTVTCAPDGKIYISGDGGLWAGRENTWEQVCEWQSSVLWNDALWFEGQLWLASDFQCRIWDGKEMKQPEYPDGNPVPVYGHMDVYDGLLLIASPEFASTFDGKAWRDIVGPFPQNG